MLFTNPLENPIFLPVITRLGIILLSGLVVVIAFNLKNLSGFFHSETWKRYYGWLIMAPTFIMGIFLGGITSLIVLMLIVYKAVREYSNMLNLPYFFRYLILINGVLSILIASLLPELAYFLPAVYLLVIMIASILRNQIENILNYATYSLFASIWICYSLTHFVLIGLRFEEGKNLLLMLGFSIALSDVMAYVVGKTFYKIGFGTKLIIAQRISPNKTYAGMIGNIGGAAIGVYSLHFLDSGLNEYELIALVCVIGVFSIIGDLMESLVKRFAGAKDSGSSIPGHGGFLDRIDSLLITSLATYYFLIITNLINL